MKSVAGIFTVAVIFLLIGCASVPMAPMDIDAKAKEFSPEPNKASLYVYRNENFGAAIPMTVSVNGKTLGQTAAQTYFRLNIMPGQYTVESYTENVSSLPLSVEAGKNYFVWQEVKMGMWAARSMLQQVDESTGRAGVVESKLIASTVLDKDIVPLNTPGAAPSALQGPSSDSATTKLRELQVYERTESSAKMSFRKRNRRFWRSSNIAVQRGFFASKFYPHTP